MTELDEVVLRLRVKVDELEKGLEQSTKAAREASGSMTKSFAGVQRGLTKLLGVVAAAAAAFVGFRAIAKTFTAIDDLAKASDRLGIATEKLVEMRHAADLAGVSAQSFDGSLTRMTRGISEAARGGGEAAKAIQELGLSAQQLASMTPDQQMRAIADAMQGVATQGDRARLAFQLFGREGVSMVNVLAQGSAGLDAMAEDARKLGLTLTRVDAAKVEAANDQLSRVGALAAGIGQKFSVEVAPFIAAAAEQITNWVAENVDFGAVVKRGVDLAIDAFGFLYAAGVRVQQGVLLLGAGFLKLSQIAVEAVGEILRRFRMVGEFIGNIGRVVVTTFATAFADVRVWIGHMENWFGILVQKVGGWLRNLLLTVAEAMREAGLKGAAAVQELGNRIGVATGDAEARGKKALQNAIAARTAAAAEMQSALDGVFSVNQDSIAFFDQSAAALGDQAQVMVNAALDLETKRLAVMETVRAAAASIREQAQKNAEEVAARSGSATGTTSTEDPAADPRLPYEEQVLAKIQEIRAAAEIADMERRVEVAAQTALLEDGRVLGEQAIQDRIAEIRLEGAQAEAKASQDMVALWESGWKGKLQITTGILSQIAQVQNGHSKKMFKVGQAAAIAETTINTYAAAIGAYKALSNIPIVGPALGAAAAAAATAAGLSNIQRIRATKFGSSGGGGAAIPAPASSTADLGGPNQGGPSSSGPRSQINVVLNGQSFSDGQVRDLIGRINDQTGDNVRLRTT